MEKLNFDCWLKNIPIPDETSYLVKFTEKIEGVTKRMRWKALFFLTDDKENQTIDQKPSASNQERFQYLVQKWRVLRIIYLT